MITGDEKTFITILTLITIFLSVEHEFVVQIGIIKIFSKFC